MTHSRDELLVSLLDRVLESSRGGSSEAMESVIRDHPELATELRELWATMQIAEDFASASELFSEDSSRRAELLVAPSIPPEDCANGIHAHHR